MSAVPEETDPITDPVADATATATSSQVENTRAAGSGALDASSEAKRLAAAILDVLAGARSPSEAAELLGLSLCRYYQLETRALTGLLLACEPRRRGGRPRSGGELAALRHECDRLRRECGRQQALLRAAQKTVGLASPAPPSPPPPAAKNSGRKRRKHRPRARALKVAAMLRGDGNAAAAKTPGTPAISPTPPPVKTNP